MMTHPRLILILEDCPDRTARFRSVVADLKRPTELRIWSSAPAMIAELDRWLPQTRLISLDHDLEPIDSSVPDVGDGLDVARVLASKTPVCPVIVHSSNRERSDWMIGELELGGWEYHRVPPIGDDWIEYDWRYVVHSLLRTRR